MDERPTYSPYRRLRRIIKDPDDWSDTPSARRRQTGIFFLIALVALGAFMAVNALFVMLVLGAIHRIAPDIPPLGYVSTLMTTMVGMLLPARVQARVFGRPSLDLWVRHHLSSRP